MLIDIIANFLQISTEKVKTIMQLLSLEKRWQQEQQWQGNKYHPAVIKTQADLITFLQAIGQTQWFKGHDRSKFADNISDQEINEKYFSLFEGLGLIEGMSYSAQTTAPDFSVILGSSESQVSSRVKACKEDFLANRDPKEKVIFGLGCNRELGVSVLETEQKSKDRLQKEGKEATEMNMVSLLTSDALHELVEQDDKFKALSYQHINTASNAKSREDKDCVKTADTATSLKQAIESQHDLSKMQKPITVAVYSCQPFVMRQARDVQQKLGADYHVVGIGYGVTAAEFNKHPKSISICLGEMARLVNISYSAENLNKYAVPLTEAELKEVQNWYQTNSEMPVIASPLPFTIIWSESDIKKFFIQAENECHYGYLTLLAQYKDTLLKNNPLYNGKAISEVQADLLKSMNAYIAALTNGSSVLTAAAYNLLGLLQRDTKDFSSAIKTFEKALSSNLSPLSRASLLHNLAYTLNANAQREAALRIQTEALEALQSIELVYIDDKHIAASIYSFLGNLYGKSGPMTAAEKAHFQALSLWSDNNVITNNAGINLSKINSVASLEQAEEILAKSYPDAKTRQLFVTPYYRADVNLKLAGHAEDAGDKDLVNKYLLVATECLKTAELSNDSEHGNKAYSINYRNKNKARLNYLHANLSYIQHNEQDVHAYKAEAEKERSQVEEKPEKSNKFLKKFPDTTQAYNPAQLFRRRHEVVTETSHLVAKAEEKSISIKK